jgi:CHAD domain-containing protein
VNPSPSDPCRPLLRQKVRSVFRRLPAALSGDEEGVHQMRVAGRRLRVALPILARHPSGKPVQKSLKILRRLTRAGGIGRDLDVVVSLFDARLRESEVGPEAAVLRRRLKAARRRSRGQLAEALLDIEIARLRRHLRVVMRHRSDGLFLALRRLAQVRDDQGAQALALLQEAGPAFDPALLHRIRRRVRRLRYAAETLGELKGQPAPAVVDLKALQDRLGALHDTFVLSQWFERQAAGARRVGASALAGEARAQQQHFLATSQMHHREFLAAAPAEAIRRSLAAMGARSRLTAVR